MIPGMRCLPPAVVLVVALAGCRSQPGASTQPPSTRAESTTPAQSDRGDAASGEPNAGAGAPTCEGGAAWDGKADCLYEHGGCCFASPRAACEAAGCTPDRCRILEFRPAQARCEEPA